MKRKRSLPNSAFLEDSVLISRDGGELFFEVGKEITSDIAEATSILMRKFNESHYIWETRIFDIKIEDITPERSLFWLTGGNSEWKNLENYNRPWCDCYLDFQEEFGFMVIKIVKRSKTLGDIRNGFLKYLNLPTLYDFAIRKDLLK